MESIIPLSLKIKSMYPDIVSDTDAFDASQRLVSFFKILADIDHANQNNKRKSNENI